MPSGFHLSLWFDKVLDIRHCYLQQDPSDAIRLEVKKYALEHRLSFYDIRSREGLLRNLIVRNSSSGDLMVILVFGSDEPDEIKGMLDHILEKFSSVTSCYYVINPKKNDSLTDLSFRLHTGRPWMVESFPAYRANKTISLHFGPASFFQTNSRQGRLLYQTAADFAEFTGDETVYDLYTGIGSMANYIAGAVGRVIGIESSPSAVQDAIENSALNNITNAEFHQGEAEKVLTPEFAATYGVPDLVITDPPRSGMHEKVVQALLALLPRKIVYISCNPATQARDLYLLKEKYDLVKCQPVDMFPHTQHVENVALLVRR